MTWFAIDQTNFKGFNCVSFSGGERERERESERACICKLTIICSVMYCVYGSLSILFLANVFGLVIYSLNLLLYIYIECTRETLQNNLIHHLLSVTA